ncbi:MAG: c-type cytochrome [Actinobacteria bacterium]|nr:c-type cytochrome [Actinomycetota bacterium]
MEARDIAVIVLLVALAGFAAAYFVVGPGRRRGPRRAGDIPLSMRPYHSDDELESTGLERAMSWGVALTLFMAFFLPVYWVLEPTRINEWKDVFYERDLEHGRLEFAEACAQCHGGNASGGSAQPPPGSGLEASWPAPALNNFVARYEDNPNVEDVEEFMLETIRRGRAGTPMPAWSAAYGGAMNDQQIESIVAYLLSIQVDKVEEPQAFRGAGGAEIFDANCVRCHGPGGSGQRADGPAPAPELIHEFARYGADGTPENDRAAREAVRHTIEEGRRVPGGLPPMPAWQGVLTEDAITRLVDYLQSIQQRAS